MSKKKVNIDNEVRESANRMLKEAIDRLHEGIITKEVSVKECAFILKDVLPYVTPKLTATLTQTQVSTTSSNQLLSNDDTEFLES